MSTSPYLYQWNRKSDGGTMSLLRVGRDQLPLPAVRNTLDQQDISGVIPGPCAVLFQTAEGNKNDFAWFVGGHLEKHVELLVDENLQQVRLRTWNKPDLVTSLSFTFKIERDDPGKLAEIVRKQVQGG